MTDSTPPVCIESVARKSWREAFAWACCVSFVGGMMLAQIVLAW